MIGWLTVIGAVIVRPHLWVVSVRQVLRLAPAGWWRRRPWLPIPDRDYLRFRMVTAFGPDGGPPPAREVVSYLEWCRAWPRSVER